MLSMIRIARRLSLSPLQEAVQNHVRLKDNASIKTLEKHYFDVIAQALRSKSIFPALETLVQQNVPVYRVVQ